MISFFKTKQNTVIAVKYTNLLSKSDCAALEWLFDNANLINDADGLKEQLFIGPRREMITPWSTTAVEITQNMNIKGIERIEEFFPCVPQNGVEPHHDKMLQRVYHGLNSEIFTVDIKPEQVVYITDFEEYNKKEGLALNTEEIKYLSSLSEKLGRPLTDSEVFGFSQVNSEHCRHKIFNGTFIIDGQERPSSLFKLIKRTSIENPNLIVSAYKDNCAFLKGPKIKMFHPKSGSKPDFFLLDEQETVISLKAETHNFPTTVEPFNGAATGTGGEIRDRMAGGKGSFPIAGTAVYMASYPRFYSAIEESDKCSETTVENLASQIKDPNCKAALSINRRWESSDARPWLYQSPQAILTKASNGASDFGNKFGQCIICGSLLTFEYDGLFARNHTNPKFGYDKVIMLAGGIGYAKKSDSIKEKPGVNDSVVLLGGDNYRIGMGGGAVSSVNTGQYNNSIELNAIQRSNPEMQKRVYNAIRSISESDNNTIISVHDHGAGGHLNCFSELVEETGGEIDISKLPVGDHSLSLKEIIGNESQERMGLVLKNKDVSELKAIAERERAPMYVVGNTTGDHNFVLRDKKNGIDAINLAMGDMFGSAPKTIMKDVTCEYKFDSLKFNTDYDNFISHLKQVLQMESVACKDWLTNKVDRSVTGLIACQQTVGEIQLPLNNLGVTAIGYDNKEGIATSLGHAPIVGLIDSAAGSRLSISEALTNILWAPLTNRLTGVSLSANWMWPSRNKGEDARLYSAVEAVSDFAVALGINVPTGKDSMSMTQNYPDGSKVLAPGTLIISAASPVTDINNIVHPNLKPIEESQILYIPFVTGKECEFALGGSAFAQTLNQIGNTVPDVKSPEYFKNCFNCLQELIENNYLLAGHDISSGGLITTLLEMNFANVAGGMRLQMADFISSIKGETCQDSFWSDMEHIMFSEQPGVVVQVDSKSIENISKILKRYKINSYNIGSFINKRAVVIETKCAPAEFELDIDLLRDIWYKTSFLMDVRQSGRECAIQRYQNYKNQPLKYSFPLSFKGDYKYKEPSKSAPIAAIIREKGSNGDREMAWALQLAGFRVKDVHMTDLVTGRETLESVKMIVFVGGFSNADTLGSAKGWAGAFLYNERAKQAIDNFYARKDTMSLGVCNGCQLMAELGLITPENRSLSPKMLHNDSKKYESAFIGVEIESSPSIMLKSLEGSKLGIWVAHGEGKFSFPMSNVDKDFNVAVKFAYNDYPANPNGSPSAIAGVCSGDGRHLAMMPHPERAIHSWNWPCYPGKNDEITPWIEMFVNARTWLERQNG